MMKPVLSMPLSRQRLSRDAIASSLSLMPEPKMTATVPEGIEQGCEFVETFSVDAASVENVFSYRCIDLGMVFCEALQSFRTGSGCFAAGNCLCQALEKQGVRAGQGFEPYVGNPCDARRR